MVTLLLHQIFQDLASSHSEKGNIGTMALGSALDPVTEICSPSC